MAKATLTGFTKESDYGRYQVWLSDTDDRAWVINAETGEAVRKFSRETAGSDAERWAWDQFSAEAHAS